MRSAGVRHSLLVILAAAHRFFRSFLNMTPINRSTSVHRSLPVPNRFWLTSAFTVPYKFTGVDSDVGIVLLSLLFPTSHL